MNAPYKQFVHTCSSLAEFDLKNFLIFCEKLTKKPRELQKQRLLCMWTEIHQSLHSANFVVD